MAALSAFMQGETNRKTIEYMDDAILTYTNSCKMPQFATRATLLSAECLKGRGLYGEAAKQLIRMTSEDSDLRSALLLEQAAYCFIGPKMMRKYAFHAVLAGHRFSKAGQRKHSLRCYQQAYQVDTQCPLNQTPRFIANRRTISQVTYTTLGILRKRLVFGRGSHPFYNRQAGCVPETSFRGCEGV